MAIRAPDGANKRTEATSMGQGGKEIGKVRLVGAVQLVDWMVTMVKLVKWLGC